MEYTFQTTELGISANILWCTFYVKILESETENWINNCILNLTRLNSWSEKRGIPHETGPTFYVEIMFTALTSCGNQTEAYVRTVFSYNKKLHLNGYSWQKYIFKVSHKKGLKSSWMKCSEAYYRDTSVNSLMTSFWQTTSWVLCISVKYLKGIW
jgi:hypothetical protein